MPRKGPKPPAPATKDAIASLEAASAGHAFNTFLSLRSAPRVGFGMTAAGPLAMDTEYIAQRPVVSLPLPVVAAVVPEGPVRRVQELLQSRALPAHARLQTSLAKRIIPFHPNQQLNEMLGYAQKFLDPESHWVWSGARNGSPIATYDGRRYHIARLILMLMYSTESPAALPDRPEKRCGVPMCVNPIHYDWGSNTDLFDGTGLPGFTEVGWSYPWPAPGFMSDTTRTEQQIYLEHMAEMERIRKPAEGMSDEEFKAVIDDLF